jgi:uncharacterized HAD superfamily protein
MRIGVDCDGVLADFNTAFIAYTIKVTGVDKFPKRPFEITTWNYPQSYGYTEKQVSAVWDCIKQDHIFWATLPTYDDSECSCDMLNEHARCGDEIYIITNRMGLRPKDQTEMWLEKRGYQNPTVLITADKAGAARVLQLDAYIDDKFENCDDVSRTVFRGQKVRTFMLDRPWNRQVEPKGVTRVESVAEMLVQLAPV